MKWYILGPPGTSVKLGFARGAGGRAQAGEAFEVTLERKLSNMPKHAASRVAGAARQRQQGAGHSGGKMSRFLGKLFGSGGKKEQQRLGARVTRVGTARAEDEGWNDPEPAGVRPAGFDDPDIVAARGGGAGGSPAGGAEWMMVEHGGAGEPEGILYAGEPEGILYADEGGAAAAAAAADGDAPLLLRAGDGAVLGLVLAALRDLEGSAELARAACVCRALRAAAGAPALWTAVRLGAGAAPVSDAALTAACARAGGGLESLDVAAGGPASGLRWFSLVRAVQARPPARPPLPPARPAAAARPSDRDALAFVRSSTRR